MMREYAIIRMEELVAHQSGSDRWRPVKAVLLSTKTGLDPTSKRGKKAITEMHLANMKELTAHLMDSEIIDLLVLISRRSSIQM